MGTTSLGIYYPDPSGVPKRQDFQDIATTANAAILAASPQSAWLTFSPAWTATGTNPVIGNGSIVGRYIQLGKTVFLRASITMGSTTTYGSGQYILSLPVTAAAGSIQLADAFYFNGTNYRGYARMPAGATTLSLFAPNTTAGAADRVVSSTVPFTFASTNSISVSGCYEAA